MALGWAVPLSRTPFSHLRNGEGPFPQGPSAEQSRGLWGSCYTLALFQNLPPRSFAAVKVKISSNWGNPRFTCMYRVRVHGSVTPPKDSHLEPLS